MGRFTKETEQGQTSYSAFISYRHKEPDATIAKNLVKMLETYHIPREVQKKSGITKLKKAFRDQDELPLSSDLGQDIHTALHNSDWMISLCSPAYLESKWCMEEVNYYIETENKKDHILTMLVEGEPAESFPKQLLTTEENGETVEIEPLAANVVAETTRQALRRLKEEKLRILAPMLGVTYDELRRRERERKLKRIILVSIGVAILAGGFGLYAWNRANVIKNQAENIERQAKDIERQAEDIKRQADDIARQAVEIERERRVAAGNEVQLLSEKSLGLTQKDDRKQALKYALEAYEVSDTIDGDFREDARAALSAACYTSDFTRVKTVNTDNMSIFYWEYAPDDTVYAGIAKDMVVGFDSASGEILYCVADTARTVDRIEFSADSSMLMSVCTGSNDVNIYDSHTGEHLSLIHLESGSMGYLKEAKFMADGRVLAVTSNDYRMFDAATGEMTGSFELPGGGPSFISSRAFNMEHGLMAFFSSDGSATVEIINFEKNTWVIAATGYEGYGIWSGGFSPDGRYLACNVVGIIVVLDAETGKVLCETPMGENREVLWPTSTVYSPDNSMIISLYSDRIVGSRAKDCEQVYSVPIEQMYGDGGIRFIGDGEYFYSESCPNRIFRTATGEIARNMQAEGLLIQAAAHNGRELLMKNGSNSLGIHNMIGEGSQETIENYTGELVKITNFGEPYRTDLVETFFEDTSYIPLSGMYQQRIYVSPNGRYAVLTNKGTYIKIWDLEVSNEEMYRSYGNSNISGISLSPALCFSADSRYFATAGYDGRCVVFNLEEGRNERVFYPYADTDGAAAMAVLSGVTFNADGSLVMLATETTGEYYVYSVKEGVMLYRLYANREVMDFGFDTVTGNAMICYADGSALAAKIFTDDAELLEYVERIAK